MMFPLYSYFTWNQDQQEPKELNGALMSMMCPDCNDSCIGLHWYMKKSSRLYSECMQIIANQLAL